MIKKTYIIKNLKCANCANKIELNLSKIKEITSSSVNFILGKIIIEFDDNLDYELIKEKLFNAAQKVEPRCQIIENE